MEMALESATLERDLEENPTSCQKTTKSQSQRNQNPLRRLLLPPAPVQAAWSVTEKRVMTVLI